MKTTPRGALLAICLGALSALGCGKRPSSAVGAPASAPAAAPQAAAVPSGPPSASACEGLWSEYHGIVPESPYLDHDGLVARCTRSEPAVLGCVGRTKAETEAMLAGLDDAGPPEPLPPGILAFFMATRIGVCLTRERLLFALHTGELGRLAREVASGGPAEGPFGTRVVAGSYATLPWPGFHEGERTAEPAPPGEIRVSRRKDGRVWLYFLGALLGRHQNQIGFLYADAPFVPADFSPEPGSQGGRATEEVCLDHGESPEPRKLYMLTCFTVLERMSPQLIEVGASPD